METEAFWIDHNISTPCLHCLFLCYCVACIISHLDTTIHNCTKIQLRISMDRIPQEQEEMEKRKKKNHLISESDQNTSEGN